MRIGQFSQSSTGNPSFSPVEQIHTATHDTLVLDDAPILVRLAVFLPLGLSQKQDSESSRANLMLEIG